MSEVRGFDHKNNYVVLSWKRDPPIDDKGAVTLSINGHREEATKVSRARDGGTTHIYFDKGSVVLLPHKIGDSLRTMFLNGNAIDELYSDWR